MITTTSRPRRSVLYVPGNNERALDKARTLPADALILDLEDSVLPEAKEAAREQVMAALRTGGFGRREIVVRVNGSDTPWGAADLSAAARSGAHAVLVPKAGVRGDLAHADEALERAGAPAEQQLWAMIETPRAILNIGKIAAESEGGRLSCFVLGTNDLAKATRARLGAGRAAMQAWLSLTVAAARAHAIDVIDGVFNGLKDAAGFKAECEQGRDLGMDGKTLIHPGQIEVANQVFAPDPEEVAFARKVLAAFAQPENKGRGVLVVDGKMVERLHAEMAERTVALADAIAHLKA